jgi:hypothetical protein
MSEVKSFKMVGGDEVVAEVTDTIYGNPIFATKNSGAEKGEITGYTVRRPHILQFQPMPNGNIGLAFIPWTLSNPTIERLNLPVSALIIPPFDPSPNVTKQYLEQTSGIALVTPGTRIST